MNDKIVVDKDMLIKLIKEIDDHKTSFSNTENRKTNVCSVCGEINESYPIYWSHPDPDAIVKCAWFGNREPLGFERILGVFFVTMMHLRGSF